MRRKTIRERYLLTTLVATTLTTILSLTRVTFAQEVDANTAAPSTPQPYTDDTPAPLLETSTTRSTFPNRPLLITGAVLLGASYGASALVAAASSGPENEKLYYPVIGPWMDLDDRNCGLRSCSGTKTMYQVLLIGDGVVQGVGALAVLLSLVIPERTTRHWFLIGNDSLRIAPQLGAVAGLSAMGSF